MLFLVLLGRLAFPYYSKLEALGPTVVTHGNPFITTR